MEEDIPQYPTGYVPKVTPLNIDHEIVFGTRYEPQPQTPENQQKIREQTPYKVICDETNNPPTKKHNHYYKDVSKLEYIDVYRVLGLFNVTDPCVQHAVKKLLVAGGRGAGKDIGKDIQEAIDSLVRYQEIKKEDGK
jgi:hypothetical protein